MGMLRLVRYFERIEQAVNNLLSRTPHGPFGRWNDNPTELPCPPRPLNKLKASGTIKVNRSKCVTEKDFQEICSFVEQENASIGSLTIRETLDFAARLSLDR